MNKKTKMISQCCVCKKVRRKEDFKFTHRKHMDEWGHHHNDLKDLHNEFDIVYSHGYCEECAEPLMEEIEVLRRIRNKAFEKELKF